MDFTLRVPTGTVTVLRPMCALVVENIIGDIPSGPLPAVQGQPYLQGLQLAEPSFDKPDKWTCCWESTHFHLSFEIPSVIPMIDSSGPPRWHTGGSFQELASRSNRPPVPSRYHYRLTNSGFANLLPRSRKSVVYRYDRSDPHSRGAKSRRPFYLDPFTSARWSLRGAAPEEGRFTRIRVLQRPRVQETSTEYFISPAQGKARRISRCSVGLSRVAPRRMFRTERPSARLLLTLSRLKLRSMYACPSSNDIYFRSHLYAHVISYYILSEPIRCLEVYF